MDMDIGDVIRMQKQDSKEHLETRYIQVGSTH
jgi:hypothetical protein